MHTSVAELIEDAPARTVTVRIRLFADDFSAAAGMPADSAAEGYVRGNFTLADRSGGAVPLRWDGMSREGDVVVVRLSAAVPGGLAGARVGNTLLCERFEDQINIVRATYGGRSVSLLFTRGDRPKMLP